MAFMVPRIRSQRERWLEYGHQYNVHSRQMMYSWFSKYLLGEDATIKEAPYKPVTPSELSVYDDKHPRPKDELHAEKLREAMTKASDEQMVKLAPKDAETLKEFRRVVGTALKAMVNDELPNDVETRMGPAEVKVDDLSLMRAVLGRVNEKDAHAVHWRTLVQNSQLTRKVRSGWLPRARAASSRRAS